MYGDNGSGKTSFLESIYYLAYGRSFRANSYKKLLRFNSNFFAVYTKLTSFPRSVGVKKTKDGQTNLLIDLEKITNFFEIAKRLPVLLINNQSYLLLDGEPQYRRKFLDWVLFHVEPTFLSAWQKFRKVLAHRNALIKSLENDPSLLKTLDYWDEKYINLASEIHQFRLTVVEQFKGVLKEVLQNIPPLQGFTVTLNYKAGWKQGVDLKDCVFNARGQDLSFKTTTQGPHRADLNISVNKKLAKFVLSRGQLKLLVFALNLAAAKLLEVSFPEKKSLFLIDDVYSELDSKSSDVFIKELKNLGHQAILTSVAPPCEEHVKELDMGVFHVEQGVLSGCQ